MKWLLFLSAFYRCGNWNKGKFNNFPKVTQLITKTWLQEVWLWSLCSWLLHYKCCLYCCLLRMLTSRMCPEGESLNWKALCRIVDSFGFLSLEKGREWPRTHFWWSLECKNKINDENTGRQILFFTGTLQ